jgi:tetratricopeptide (TPR) repeat protein
MAATLKCGCGQSLWIGEDEPPGPVTCPTCGRQAVAEPPKPRAAPDAPVAFSGPVIVCAACGRGGATEVVVARVVSLVLTHDRRWKVMLCPGCARRALLAQTFITTFFGWWGLRGLFLTPAALAINTLSLAKSSDLPGPFGVLAGLLVSSMPFVLAAALLGWLPSPDASKPDEPAKKDPLAELLAEGLERAEKAGDWALAATQSDHLLHRQPDRPGLKLAAGRVYLRAGRNRDAETVLRAAGDPAARPLLAEALWQLQRPDEALAELADDRPEIRAPALVRLGQVGRAARIEPTGPRSILAVTAANVALGRWREAAEIATTPEAKTLVERALGCLSAAERVATGDDAAWLALDRGDPWAARRLATSSPWGAVAASIADRLLGIEEPAALREGDDQPLVRLIVAAFASPRSLLCAVASSGRMSEEERVAVQLAAALAFRSGGDEAGVRRTLRRVARSPVGTPGRALAARLAGEPFDDPDARFTRPRAGS